LLAACARNRHKWSGWGVMGAQCVGGTALADFRAQTGVSSTSVDPD